MKRYHVRILPAAERDLDAILAYLRSFSAAASEKYQRELIEGILSLETFPLRCPPARDALLAEKGYRYLIVEHYLIFFLTDGDTVKIRRILDGRSNYL